MLVLKSLRAAEKFVSNQQSLGNKVYWDGWNIVCFRPDPRGRHSTAGAFKDGQWGFANVSKVEDNGTWFVDYRNVRRGAQSVI